MGDSVEIKLILFENQIQTTSTSPCRTQVQPAASFLVCSLIFIEYKPLKNVILFRIDVFSMPTFPVKSLENSDRFS